MAANNNPTQRTFIEGLTFDDVLLVPAFSEIRYMDGYKSLMQAFEPYVQSNPLQIQKT